MAKYNINSILGGISHSYFFGQEGSYSGSCGIDPERRINGRISGAISPTPMSEDGEGGYIFLQENDKNDNTYYLKPTGEFGIYDGALLNTFTSGNGMAYYNNYYYIADTTDIHRYGPMDGTPSIEENWWTSLKNLSNILSQARGSEVVIENGANTKVAQSFSDVLVFNKMKLGLKNIGTDTDYYINVSVYVAEEDQTEKSLSAFTNIKYDIDTPTTERVGLARIHASDITNEMAIHELTFGNLMSITEKHIFVIEPSEIDANKSFSVMKSVDGNVYTKGMILYYDTDWDGDDGFTWDTDVDNNTVTSASSFEELYSYTIGTLAEDDALITAYMRFNISIASGWDSSNILLKVNGSYIPSTQYTTNKTAVSDNFSAFSNQTGDYEFTITGLKHDDIITLEANAQDSADSSARTVTMSVLANYPYTWFLDTDKYTDVGFELLSATAEFVELKDTQHPLIGSLRPPNHTMYVHGNNAMYIADKNKDGLIHKIQTGDSVDVSYNGDLASGSLIRGKESLALATIATIEKTLEL